MERVVTSSAWPRSGGSRKPLSNFLEGCPHESWSREVTHRLLRGTEGTWQVQEDRVVQLAPGAGTEE